MENTIIPDIVNPLGKYWEQPNKSEILIDDSNAIMSESTLKQLKNYSHSSPSGVYEGKMWRSEHEGKNYLHWYGLSKQADKCSYNFRLILIIN